MNVLITGADGFSARHLISVLSKRDNLQLSYSDVNPKGRDDLYPCDLADLDSTLALIAKTKPKQIYHLAGSFSNNYEDDYKGNVVTTKNILDSVFETKLKCRILIIGSSAEYGNVALSDNPVKEGHPLNPVSIYGLTKVYQTHLIKHYFSIYNLDIVMARTFNLFGNGISDRLFIGKVYDQINKYKKGNISKITLGNLDNKRDYIAAEDACKYYAMIMNYGVSGEIYNVGSGRSTKIYDLLQMILKENKLSMDIVNTNADNNLNKIDISDIYADIKKLLNLSNSTLHKTPFTNKAKIDA